MLYLHGISCDSTCLDHFEKVHMYLVAFSGD